VLVPCFPGALSALGILRADVTKDLSRTVRLDIRNLMDSRRMLLTAFSALEREGRSQLRAEGFSGKAIRIDRALDMRYSGQSYDLIVPFGVDIVNAFHGAHERRYGYSDRARLTEVVNIHARFTGRTPKPGLPKWRAGAPNPKGAAISRGIVIFAGRRFTATVYDRSKLKSRNRIVGPAVVAEYSATTFISPAGLAVWTCTEISSWSARDERQSDSPGNIQEPVPLGRGRNGRGAPQIRLLTQYQGEARLFLRGVQ
jgi:N-methylhydantoinase A